MAHLAINTLTKRFFSYDLEKGHGELNHTIMGRALYFIMVHCLINCISAFVWKKRL